MEFIELMLIKMTTLSVLVGLQGIFRSRAPGMCKLSHSGWDKRSADQLEAIVSTRWFEIAADLNRCLRNKCINKKPLKLVLACSAEREESSLESRWRRSSSTPLTRLQTHSQNCAWSAEPTAELLWKVNKSHLSEVFTLEGVLGWGLCCSASSQGSVPCVMIAAEAFKS